MSKRFTRREFVATTGSAAALTLGSPFIARAQAAGPLTIADWGAPWGDNSKKLLESWGKASANWSFYAGGAASILPQIKAAWPNSPYDLCHNWSPVFEAMIKEGWLETLTLEDCPNLELIPEDYIPKDAEGNWKAVPVGSSGVFFTYAPENCPIEIKTIEDLLDPKLKGQILWPNPTLNTNLQVVALAEGRGGDQFHMEPGWKFLEELAKSGNIGRVSATSSDIITSLETGETSVTFVDEGSLGGIRNVKLHHLTKTDPSMKTFLFIVGWSVFKDSPNRDLAFDFINYTLTKEASELYFKDVGEVPLNPQAEHTAEHLKFTPEQVEEFVIVPDWDYLGRELDGWNKRFETDIVHLL